jgi:anti-sigma B factor antagonist
VEIAVSEHLIRVMVVAPKGRLDVNSVAELQKQLDALFGDGVPRIVIDLSAVPFLDSAGMAVLVRALKGANQQQGNVVLVWPAEEAARRVLALTKFDRIFTIAETVSDAVDAF